VSSETELSPLDVKELIEGDAQLVDVREAYEWEAGRLAGATHIELNELTERAAEIDKDRPVVFYCRGGNRSAMAAEAFGQAGYDAHNLAGGIAAWVEGGFPIEPEGGEVVDRHGRPPS
jgi:rhodanese-related sulfurtransferase